MVKEFADNLWYMDGNIVGLTNVLCKLGDDAKTVEKGHQNTLNTMDRD